jgi:hypothetical protein
MPKTAKPRKTWVYAPKKPAPPKVPEALKREVETKANALVESVLKPQHIQPPPEDPQFNYIEDISTKWYRSYFYFYAVYRSAGPYALGGQFEAKFARLEYIGDGLFNLAYMRYTGQWFELFTELPLDACLDSIRDDPWFHP